MERETKTIKTPNCSVVIKSYATAREIQTIESKLFEGMKVGVEKGEPSLQGFSPASQVNVEHEMIRLLVVSIDSITENILNHALDVIRSEDYDAIIAALNEITKKKSIKTA